MKVSVKSNNSLTENSFSKENDDEPDNFRKIFLGGLSPVLTEDSLRSFYRKFGEILEVKIMRDPSNSRPRGFGFITFVDSSCVDRAQAARPHVVDGKPVDSKRVLGRSDAPKSTTSSSGRKIFVGGLKEDVHDDQALTEHFKQFGNIYNVKIIVDRNTGRKRGFAYIEFEDYDSADKAVLHRNHTIKYLSVDVKKSTYKEQAKRTANQVQNGGDNSGNVGGPPPAAGAYPAGPYPPAPYAPPYGYPPYGGWGAPPAPYPGQPPAQPPAYAAQPPAYGGQPPAWNGWGYGAPPAAGPPPANPPPPTNNTNYQQSYNGGPQKGGRLQNYRNSPYRS